MFAGVRGVGPTGEGEGNRVEQVGSVGQQAPAEGIFEALIASAQESGQLGSAARRPGRRPGARARQRTTLRQLEECHEIGRGGEESRE